MIADASMHPIIGIVDGVGESIGRRTAAWLEIHRINSKINILRGGEPKRRLTQGGNNLAVMLRHNMEDMRKV